MGYNIHEHKRYYYTFTPLLFTGEHSEHYTNLSTLTITSGFFRVTSSVGIMQYVYALNCVHRFNYSRTLPQRSSPSGLWT